MEKCFSEEMVRRLKYCMTKKHVWFHLPICLHFCHIHLLFRDLGLVLGDISQEPMMIDIVIILIVKLNNCEENHLKLVILW